jgi:hypothetical protein
MSWESLAVLKETNLVEVAEYVCGRTRLQLGWDPRQSVRKAYEIEAFYEFKNEVDVHFNQLRSHVSARLDQVERNITRYAIH